jgi:hypothetical protein
MKTKILFVSAILIIAFQSCITPSYFQLYEVAPDRKNDNKQSETVYEDSNCKISYDFWKNGGDAGFVFLNKTDEDIFINKDECFFVVNGAANDYFQDRVFTTSYSFGKSTREASAIAASITGTNNLNSLQTKEVAVSSGTGIFASEGFSTSFNEKRIVCVPSHTAKAFNEFAINKSLVRDCNLLKYPKRKETKTLTFGQDESPIVFSNRITYSVGTSEESVKIENTFYVKKITNYSEPEFVVREYDEYCGQKSPEKVVFFQYVSPIRFYIKYHKKERDYWEH